MHGNVSSSSKDKGNGNLSPDIGALWEDFLKAKDPSNITEIKEEKKQRKKKTDSESVLH